jgi:hypothetical protein
MRKHYYDPSRHKTYLEQLGVQYPVLPEKSGACPFQLRR